jgi:hypothetical protein
VKLKVELPAGLQLEAAILYVIIYVPGNEAARLMSPVDGFIERLMEFAENVPPGV